MTTKEEIARARRDTELANDIAGIVFDEIKRVWPDLHPLLDLRYGIADRVIALPLLNRVRAEALRTYAQKRYLAFLEFPERDWLDQPEGTARHYAKVAADMLAEADRIEQNGEGNET